MPQSRALLILTVAASFLFLLYGALIYLLVEESAFGVFLVSTPHSWFLIPVMLLLAVAGIRRQKKAFWISLGTTLIGLPLLGLELNPPKNDERDFRFMTYNIQHGLQGMNEVARAILEADPDVALLQEATMNWEPKRISVDAFKEALPGYHFRRDWDRIILSKEPIEETWVYPLAEPKSEKSAQVSIVRIHGIPIHFVNIHMWPYRISRENWDWLYQHRKREYADLWPVLDDLSGPTIVAGDFNGIPVGKYYREMTRRYDDAFAQAGLGFGYTTTVEFPSKRIDFVFGSSQLKPLRCWSPRVFASDHLPVIVDYKILPTSAS